MYDHYCPWVVAPIGEKTHRYFLAFLFFTIQASVYYTYGYFKLLKHVYNRVRRFPYPQDSILHYVLNVLLVCLNREPFVSSAFFALFVISITLIVFLYMQASQVSRNVTQIEAAKIADLREDGVDIKKSPYDKGFIGNWRECLFPPKTEPCEPYEPEYSDGGSILIPGYLLVNDEEFERIVENDKKSNPKVNNTEKLPTEEQNEIDNKNNKVKTE